MTNREVTERFLLDLERFAEGMRHLAARHGNVMMGLADTLDKHIANFRIESAPTKRDMPPVQLKTNPDGSFDIKV